jgi:hypothetical protein
MESAGHTCTPEHRIACPVPLQEILMPRPSRFQRVPPSSRPVCRLNRTQQLTLTTWRWARHTLAVMVSSTDLLPKVAVEAVRAVLRDVTDPIALFARHADAAPEFASSPA